MNAKHHILIVDENPYVVEILVQTLKKDFIVTVANTGQEAARLLIQGNRFDCVLTELNLSFFNGLELIKLIRMSKVSAQTPIVILSDVLDSTTRIQCLEQGADDFLSKPFNPLEVNVKLHAILRRSEATIRPVAQAESKSAWLQKFRIFSLLFGNYSLPQGA